MRAQQLASVAGTTVRTIRYYHERGLLGVPDGAADWRCYGFAHLTRLMRIRWLVESGVPLAEVPHMLRPPRSGDEHATVREDLQAVISSIDERIAVLTRQRGRVATLLERVTTEGRLSRLPASIDRMYAALLERPLPPETVQAMTRERDLLELVCYHGALPEDVVALVDALSAHHLDDLCGLWEECHRINATADGISKAAGVTVTLTLLAFDFGACAMFVGALTGSRGAATGAASALAAAAYLISSLAPVVPELHSIRWLSPFSWALGNDQLAQGATVGEILALLGLGAAVAVATIPAFHRLDVH